MVQFFYRHGNSHWNLFWTSKYLHLVGKLISRTYLVSVWGKNGFYIDRNSNDSRDYLYPYHFQTDNQTF